MHLEGLVVTCWKKHNICSYKLVNAVDITVALADNNMLVDNMVDNMVVDNMVEALVEDNINKDLVADKMVNMVQDMENILLAFVCHRLGHTIQSFQEYPNH